MPFFYFYRYDTILFIGSDNMRKCTSNEFEIVYQLLEGSFDEQERRPYREQKELRYREDYEILVDDEIQGFLCIYHCSTFVFVEHFATSPAVRGKGLGKLMMEELLRQYEHIVLEVEPVMEVNQQRRIHFYERLGFTLLPYAYIQPPISKGKKELELHLMSNKECSEEEFEEIKKELYKRVYQV